MHEHLSPVDYIILAAYLLAVSGLGIVWRQRTRSVDDYLLGGRELRWWALLGSIVATETSTVTFLSIPGLAYSRGGDLRFMQLPLGYLIGRALIAVFLMPLYFRRRLRTAYELLGERLGAPSQRAAGVLFVSMRTLADGLRLFLTALVLQEVAGWSLAGCVLLLGGLTIVYTFLGGMRSVVWNDCVQLLVYLAGAIAALAWIAAQLEGGWGELATFAAREQKTRWLDLEFSWVRPYTIWSGIVAGIAISLATHGVDQLMVQRYLSARSRRDASLAVGASGLVIAAQFLLFLMLGVALACFYAQVAPQRVFDRSDRVLADFIVHFMAPGLAGLTLAAVFAAAMSTLSSSLNSSAAAMVCDVLRPAAAAGEDPRADDIRLRWSRRWTLVFGVAQMAVALSGPRWQHTVIESALGIAGLTSGVLLGSFAVAIAARRIDPYSPVWGMGLGLGVMLLVQFGTPLAWPWYAPLGAVVTVVATGALAGATRAIGGRDRHPVEEGR